jgi:hypothetical protein
VPASAAWALGCGVCTALGVACECVCLLHRDGAGRMLLGPCAHVGQVSMSAQALSRVFLCARVLSPAISMRLHTHENPASLLKDLGGGQWKIAWRDRDKGRHMPTSRVRQACAVCARPSCTCACCDTSVWQTHAHALKSLLMRTTCPVHVPVLICGTSATPQPTA